MMEWPAHCCRRLNCLGEVMSDQRNRRWNWAVWLGALLALALVVRVGVLVAMQDNLSQDPDAYRNIADNLLVFRVYGMGQSSRPPQPTAYRPPLYPMLLAQFASDGAQVVLWRVALVHVLLGLATVGLMWVVAGQMTERGSDGVTERRREGEESGSEKGVVFLFAAGLMVACDPLLVNQSTLVMTETLAAFLTVLCLFALNRFAADRRPWNAGLAGGAIALAILCRPTYLPWLGLIGLVMLLLMRTSPKSKVQGPKSEARRSSWHDRLWRGLNAGALGLIAAIVVSPWAIRNYRVFGKPIVSTTHGGYTLYLANNPFFYHYVSTSDSHLPWDSREFDESTNQRFEWESRFSHLSDPAGKYTELRYDQWCYEHAIGSFKIDIAKSAWSCLYRLRQLWSPLPHRLTADEPLPKSALRYAVAAWYIAVYLLAAVGIWKLRGKLLAPPWLWGVLLCLVFTGIHTFYWTNLRMRAPLMPFVALVAAYGVGHILSRVGQGRLGGHRPTE
jgi:hypothetical protein